MPAVRSRTGIFTQKTSGVSVAVCHSVCHVSRPNNYIIISCTVRYVGRANARRKRQAGACPTTSLDDSFIHPAITAERPKDDIGAVENPHQAEEDIGDVPQLPGCRSRRLSRWRTSRWPRWPPSRRWVRGKASAARSPTPTTWWCRRRPCKPGRWRHAPPSPHPSIAPPG